MTMVKYILPTGNEAFEFMIAIRNVAGKAVMYDHSRCVISDYGYIDERFSQFQALTKECESWDVEFFESNC